MTDREWLRSRAWSRSFLGVTAATILGVGCALAALIGGLHQPGGEARPRIPERLALFDPRTADELPDPRTWLDPWLASEATDFGDVLEALPSLALEPAAGGPEGVLGSIARSIRDARRRELATLLLRARFGDDDALEELRAHAEAEHRHANFALGIALAPSESAAAAFEREARAHGSDRARRWALESYVALGDDAAVQRLLADPGYARAADARFTYERARAELDWAAMFLWIGPAQYVAISPTYVALGIASGIIWLIFLAYAGEVRSLASSRLGLCVAALILGALSTIPTLVLSVGMEDVLGMAPSASLRGGLAYFIASVGLREELCKLLFFLPLAPIVIRRRDPLEMLVVAACVGLGFAAEENVAYFAQSGGGDAAGRFLTANFGHAVDTGLAGFAFCRMCIERERAKDFLIIFAALVIGHGVYDALIVLPELSEWKGVSGLVYIAVAFFFFGELQKYAPRRGLTVPLTAIFGLGFALLIALTLIGASWELGFANALIAVLPGTVGALLFVFVFFRQLDEPLRP